MINLLFLLTILIAVPSHADGPKYRHQEPVKQLEFENVYQDIRSIRSTTNTSSTNTWTASQTFSSITVNNGMTLSGPLTTNSSQGTSGYMLLSQGAGLSPKWASGGRILQIVTSTMTSIPIKTTTSVSYSSTSLNVNFTPLSNASRIIIFATQSFGASNAASTICTVRIQRDTTDIQKPGDPVALTNDSTTEMDVSLTLFAVDSPGDTNQHTYRTTFARSSGTGTCVANPTSVGGNGGSMILIEVQQTY